MRKRALERRTYIIKQKLGDNHSTAAELKTYLKKMVTHQ